ncbi:phosphoribosylformylglycinamidine cyclo-ligase [Granulicella paludicola]|uniref:phosphoribosylformylglycinamidine cyclo-ligase n=1 Tax=Granulicella paludicola TaxID=474951 RepID=UPI0021DFD381|nr:phosphoribosylformylglycinamidine cyclo-ligase [Granulicella paludicola]
MKHPLEPGIPSSSARAAEHDDRGLMPTDPRLLANDRIKGLARRTFNKNVISEIGGFAGLFSLDAEKFPDPVLVSSTDGVGSKLQLAAQLGLHASIGADLVNHCVNDIAIQGATPLFFLDYFATGRLDPEIVQQIISGLVDACKANGCALLGGETAERPSLYAPNDYELAGFITGVVSRPRLLTGAMIAEGDCLLGLPSNGLHTNGYTLAQKLLFETAGYAPTQYVNELGDKVGAALMRPHRSYLAPIRKLIQAEVVSGFAHITGGGITENLPRIFPRGLAPQVDLTTWDPPALFTHLQSLGSMNHEEMYGHFNMGIGLVAVVPAALLKKARTVLTRMNERSVVMGRVVRKASSKVIYG